VQNTVVKYSIIILLLLVYINRGLFVFSDELKNQGGGETNSVIEWLQQLATGESNDIDEDGNLQSDYSFTLTFVHDLPQQLTQVNLFSKEILKNRFPHKENFLLNDFRSQLEQPSEVV
jgi:hypothetical protein